MIKLNEVSKNNKIDFQLSVISLLYRSIESKGTVLYLSKPNYTHIQRTNHTLQYRWVSAIQLPAQ